ncbi:hypothetical protein GF324_04145 [bacterium]|nr:hypothetical protein [bacterium]
MKNSGSSPGRASGCASQVSFLYLHREILPHDASLGRNPVEQITTAPDRQILLLGDAHLPLDGRDGAEEDITLFRKLLRDERPRTSVLLLMGDVFDFWFEWKQVVPKRAMPLLYDLHDMIREGIEVHYFAGNHDFLIRGFLGDVVGMRLHQEEWDAEIDGRRTRLHHGDGMAQSDHGYRAMKRVFRHPVSQALFQTLVHPDLALNLGKWASDAGRRNTYKKYDGHLRPDHEYLAMARRILQGGYDMVIFGHTHQQKLLRCDDGWYHNPGPFLTFRQYSVIAGGLPEGRTQQT